MRIWPTGALTDCASGQEKRFVSCFLDDDTARVLAHKIVAFFNLMPTLLLQIPCDHHIEWHHGSRRSQKKAHWWKTSWVFLLTEIVINKQRKILCKAFFWIHLVVYVAVLTDGNFLVPLQS